MDYITASEAAKKWDVSGRSITYHLKAGRIPGAVDNRLMEGGTNGDLMLRSPITREQFCVMLKRYHDKFIK